MSFSKLASRCRTAGWAAIIAGSAYSGCTALVELPDGTIDVSRGGIFVDFPGVDIDVTRDEILVNAPGVHIEIDDNDKHKDDDD